MSDIYYAKPLVQGENFNITVLSYYNPNDATSATSVYIDKSKFRYIKVTGPYSDILAECAGQTMALKDSEVTKMNYYCYDPLTAVFLCNPVFVNNDRRQLDQVP